MATGFQTVASRTTGLDAIRWPRCNSARKIGCRWHCGGLGRNRRTHEPYSCAATDPCVAARSHRCATHSQAPAFVPPWTGLSLLELNDGVSRIACLPVPNTRAVAS